MWAWTTAWGVCVPIEEPCGLEVGMGRFLRTFFNKVMTETVRLDQLTKKKKKACITGDSLVGA